MQAIARHIVDVHRPRGSAGALASRAAPPFSTGMSCLAFVEIILFYFCIIFFLQNNCEDISNLRAA